MTGFEKWKKLVDEHVQRLCGLSADDLPDWDYYSAYEDDVSPAKAAKMAIAAARNF